MALSAVETSLLTTEFVNYMKTSIVLQELFQAAVIPTGEGAKVSDITTLFTTVAGNLYNQTQPTFSPPKYA